MTQDNKCNISVCEYWKNNSTCGRCEKNCKHFDRMFCKINSLVTCYQVNDCDYKLRIKTEKQLQKSLEDNYTLGKRIDFIEKQLKDILNYGE